MCVPDVVIIIFIFIYGRERTHCPDEKKAARTDFPAAAFAYARLVIFYSACRPNWSGIESYVCFCIFLQSRSLYTPFFLSRRAERNPFMRMHANVIRNLRKYVGARELLQLSCCEKRGREIGILLKLEHKFRSFKMVWNSGFPVGNFKHHFFYYGVENSCNLSWFFRVSNLKLVFYSK
jgi:hypothetical protein